MSAKSILTLSIMGFVAGNTAEAQAKANLYIQLNKATHKMVKHKNSGDRYPLNGPVIRVYSKGGDRYDSIASDNEDMTFLVNLSANCNRKIRSLSLEINGVSRNVRHTSNKGKTVRKRTESLKTPFTPPAISRNPVQACRNELDERAALTNRSQASWMKSGFVVKYDNAYEARVTGSCSAALGKGDFEAERIALPVWIVCEPVPTAQMPKDNSGGKGAGQKIPARKAKPQMLALTLAATPKVSESCPTSIKFTGHIRSSKAGVVKYRIMGREGGQSWTTPVKTVTFDKAGRRAISQWTHSYHRPDTGKTLAMRAPGGPKAIRGEARMVIVGKPGGATVKGDMVRYEIWCGGKPGRAPKNR